MNKELQGGKLSKEDQSILIGYIKPPQIPLTLSSLQKKLKTILDVELGEEIYKAIYKKIRCDIHTKREVLLMSKDYQSKLSIINRYILSKF